MKYNAECTVWHKTDDGYITQHYPCWWQDTYAQTISKTGSIDVDTAMIHLPLSAVVNKSDYIAVGNIEYDVAGSVTDLLKTHHPLKISMVSPKNYGSEIMRHTE